MITPADMIADYYGESPWIRGLVTLVGALYGIPYVVRQVKAGGILARGLFPEAAPIPLWGMELTIEDAGVGALSLVTMLYVIVGGCGRWRGRMCCRGCCCCRRCCCRGWRS